MRNTPLKAFAKSTLKQKTERETWKEGLREHSKNLKQESEALKTGDKLTSNIIAFGGHKKRVEDAKKQ